MAIKKYSKKGMFFTLTVIILLSFFLVSFRVYSLKNSQEDSVYKRVETLNNFVFSIEEDLPRQIYASSFRILFLMNKEILEKGEYIQNLNESFEELFYNGSLNGEEKELMNGVIMEDISESINERAKRINAQANLSNTKIIISQKDSWNIKVVFNATLLILDEGNVAGWNKSVEIISYVLINGFEDPLYLKETNGAITNKINKTIFEGFTQGSDVSNLSQHLQGSYYIASSLAPSFLDRLQGINNANENGIESLVYLPNLANAGITPKEKSCVDYIYFSDTNPSSFKIQGMPSWFMIDTSHLEIYQAENLTI